MKVLENDRVVFVI